MDVPIEEVQRKIGELVIENLALKTLVEQLQRQLPDLEDITTGE